jgi:hypothetical protein
LRGSPGFDLPAVSSAANNAKATPEITATIARSENIAVLPTAEQKEPSRQNPNSAKIVQTFTYKVDPTTGVMTEIPPTNALTPNVPPISLPRQAANILPPASPTQAPKSEESSPGKLEEKCGKLICDRLGETPSAASKDLSIQHVSGSPVFREQPRVDTGRVYQVSRPTLLEAVLPKFGKNICREDFFKVNPGVDTDSKTLSPGTYSVPQARQNGCGQDSAQASEPMQPIDRYFAGPSSAGTGNGASKSQHKTPGKQSSIMLKPIGLTYNS